MASSFCSFFKIILAPQMVHGEVDEQIVGDLYGLHSASLLSATVATIATVILAVSDLPLQPSQPSRGLFAFSIIGQRDTPSFMTNLVLIADMVFIQQPTGLYIQILA